jgi:xylulokinase
LKRCVIGIDVGTSGCKTILVDDNGKIIASSIAEYPLYQPYPGWSEQNPEDWWTGVKKTLNDILRYVRDAQLKGISFSGQMHGMVALDADNRVVRPAILWNDQRTQTQCDEITAAAGGLQGLVSYTNNMMLTGYTGGKILWMKENEPENYDRTVVVINPKDYIRYRLTNVIATEVSDASGTGLFNVKERRWAYELIKKVGLKLSLFPKCAESTDQLGVVSGETAAETGLPQGIPVYAGGGDAVISTTGAGLIQPGKIGITLGTSGVVALGLPDYADNIGGKLQLFCNNAPGTWMAFGCTLAAAGSYQWFKNALGVYEQSIEKDGGPDAYEQLNRLAGEVAPGSDGLLYMPYLTGERCPLFDPYARGGFIGITASMKKGHFARAVLEGVCFSMKHVYDLIMECTTVDPSSIVVSGGGAKSELWQQILADVFQLPVCTVSSSEAGGAFGAALVAGVGCGLWDNLSEAMSTIHPVHEVQPNKANAEVYRRAYRAYVKLYDSLKWYFSQQADDVIV